MTKDEAKFADLIVNYDQKVLEARQYIEENFGVNTKWDAEENRLDLYTDNINEGLQLMAAKEYVEETFPAGAILLNI